MQRSEFWPDQSAHQIYWERHNNPHVYEYDPADDGPEVEVIATFRVAFPFTWDPAINRAALSITRGAADWLFTTLAAFYIEEKVK